MKIRLAHKFTAAFLAIGLAAAALAVLLLQRELKGDLTKRFEEELVTGVRVISLMPQAEIVAQAAELAKRMGARLTLIDPTGGVVADSGVDERETGGHLNRSEIQEARLRGIGKAIRYSHALQREKLFVAAPIGDGEAIAGYVRLSRPLEEVTLTIGPRRQAFFGILSGVVAAVLLAALLFSLRTLSPLGRLLAYSERVRARNLPQMAPLESGDEIGRITGNIKAILASLQERFRLADQERRKLESLFACMNTGVLVLDADNRIASMNPAMERMSGRPVAEMVGRTPLQAFRNIQLHKALERYRHGKEILTAEISLETLPPVVMEVTISAVPAESLSQLKTLLVFHDVTHLRRLERVRTDFVANITHEIRTPLTAIIGFAETLRQGALENPETARNFLRTIQENAERLNRLVDDLLTLSRLELGETRLKLEAVEIGDAVERALAVVEAGGAAKGIAIENGTTGELPAIRADRDRLAQVLLNILDNAIKFSPEGGKITVTAEARDGAGLTVRIADSGVGIAKGEIPRLGERFYRADRMRSREVGGTGLGLSIVKHLMAAHQGEMTIDSAPGRGTTVSLRFPLYRETA